MTAPSPLPFDPPTEVAGPAASEPAVSPGPVDGAGRVDGPGPTAVGPAGEELAARVALVKLTGMGPARVAWLLEAGSAAEAAAALADGRLPVVGHAPPGVNPTLIHTWTTELRAMDQAGLLAELRAHRAVALVAGDPEWPFADDPAPPAVLFCQGRLGLLAPGPKVALVGTRRCSAVGRQVAYRFGRELAERGVTVVSGLAAGIDGAAHQGTLAAGGPALAVVGSGLDRIYPGVHRALWQRIGREGLLISESPLGTKPEPWRFPARNRLIAGLADAVVVIESHDRGGALITVVEAAERGRPVLAVPGAITNPASVGCNALLADGCAPACSVADILDAIGWDAPPARAPAEADGPGRNGAERASPLARTILREIQAGEVHIDVVIARAGAGVPEVLAEIQRLVARGMVELDGSTVMLPPQRA